ncbi:MAG: 30S ribosomal protein S12 methylthiotransferase RimO [Firmicutes bacterium]|nr:30S ribosomal protein S12 methylthiotransferase RimO [Bacillota bacterium]
MSLKINFVSLGCDKNLVDSEIMLGLIDEKGYIITDDPYESDIIIINSCGFIMSASQEGIDKILEVADCKTNGSCRGIIVTGCMAQRYKEEIFDSLPEVDAVVGTGDFENIGSVIDSIVEGQHSVKLVTDINNNIQETNSYKRMLTTVGGFGYIKIAEGCDMHCTYCTIPSLRGKYRSRTLESLVKEAKILAEKGVRELILVAQDTSVYGKDLYGENKLHTLLHVLSLIEDIKWLRIMYCYPENIYDELINEMATNKKVLHYLDMPIQHTGDRILKLMGRRSNGETIRKTVEKLRTAMPDICIRTTLITGFPTETEEEFDEEVAFLKELKLDRIGVFTYSPEDGTPAAAMEGQIEEDIKEERKESLMREQMLISAEIGQRFVGEVLEVIVEGKIDTVLDEDKEDRDIYCGRSYRDCYEIDGYVFFPSEEELIAGDFYNIKINTATDYDLIGEIYESAE